MKIWVILALLAFGMALVPSCKEKSQVSSRVIVTAMGIDAAEEGYQLSVQSVEPLLTSGSLTEQQENATTVYDAQGQSIAQALNTFVFSTGRSAFIMHNRVVAVGMEVVEERSLTEALDYFIRNHEGRPLVDVVIVRGEAAQVLDLKSTAFTVPAEQISMMLKEGKHRGIAVRTRLLDVERASSGMYDVAVPVIEMVGEGEAQSASVAGTALFRQGEYVGTVTEEATRGLLFARGDLETCTYALPLSEGDQVTVEVESASVSIEVEPRGETARFILKITARGEVEDETLAPQTLRDRLPEVDEALTGRIEEEVLLALRETIQERGCDVVGFRRRLMQSAPSLIQGKEEEWRDRLRTCEYVVQVDAQVDRFGEEAEQ